MPNLGHGYLKVTPVCLTGVVGSPRIATSDVFAWCCSTWWLVFGMRAFKLIKLVIFKDKEKHPSKRDLDKSCVELGFGEQIPDGECSEGVSVRGSIVQ